MLRLTQEADNALRMLLLLSETGKRTDAATLARRAGIPTQFALKILRKLKEGGLVCASAGAHGGYLTALPPDRITVLAVIERIDGPLYLNRCLEQGFVCSRMGTHTECCAVHRLFAKVNQSLSEQLGAITLTDLVCDDESLLSHQGSPTSADSQDTSP